MHAADYKRAFLGLICLKYISHSFDIRYEKPNKEPHA
jgi:hypothetical protein